jgi:hypothetical protein
MSAISGFKWFMLHLFHWVCHPVNTIADALHHFTLVRNIESRMLKFERRHYRFVIGLFFMLSGSGLAVSSGGFHLSHSSHIVVDMIAYAVHGCGAVPFVNIIIKKLALE